MVIYFYKKTSLQFTLFLSLFILHCDCFRVYINEKGVNGLINKTKTIYMNKQNQISPLKNESGKNAIEKPKKEKQKEEIEQYEAEKEQVKKLMVEYNRRINGKSMAKYVEELKNDEKLKQVLKELEAARAKHPQEKRKAVQSITEINAEHLDELYQGDIELSLEQAQFLLDSISTEENGTSRVKRGATKNVQQFHKWPLIVPFSFDNTISWAAEAYEMKTAIHSAIQLWNANTCLDFVQDDSTSPRIEFKNQENKGCVSGVGMLLSKPYQNVYLEYPGCFDIGSIAHEIGHALGLIHEQQRHDRDSYIWVYPDNIEREKEFTLEKETTESSDNYQVPYDLGSVMHYTAKAFSNNDQYTMVPKAGASYINTIGQNYGPSYSDYMVINKHYCGLELLPDGSSINTEFCHATTTCDNDGFQNPKNCFDCICSPGYVGTKCEDVNTIGYAPVGVINSCNGTILFATPNWQELYGKIGDNNLNSKLDYAYCHWQILADIGETINIHILDVGETCSDGCVWGNTEIRTAANRGAAGIRLCCRSDLGSSGQLQITASNGYALISLYSFVRVQRFRIRFRI